IYVNNVNGNATVDGSIATGSLKIFGDMEKSIVSHAQKIQLQAERSNYTSAGYLDSLKKRWSDTMQVLKQHYYDYADTVKNFAAFMMVYNKIDFGNNYEQQKKFVLHAAERFGKYKQMRDLKNDVIATAEIYEEEYNVGDTLPSVTLPDFAGNN